MNAIAATGFGRVRAPLPEPRRVLVADDERDTVLTLVALLRDEGHEARGVHRPEDVLAVARGFNPHVFILDIAMPGKSGYAVANEVRSSYRGTRKPLLIAITGQYKRPTDVLMSKAAGFDHHLTKPYDPVALLALVTDFSPED